MAQRLLLSFLLILANSFSFAQENKTETMLIYPKCEKLVKKGNESLQNCFLEKLVNELAESATYILSRDKILYADLKVEIRFIVDEKGKYLLKKYKKEDFIKALKVEIKNEYNN